jgi:hypothetical protein
MFITASFFALAFSSEIRTKTNATNEKTSIFLNDPVCEIIEKLIKSGKNNFNDIKGGLQSEEKEYDGSTTKIFNTSFKTSYKNELYITEDWEHQNFILYIYNGKSKDEVDQLEEKWLNSMDKCLATYKKHNDAETKSYSISNTTYYDEDIGFDNANLKEKIAKMKQKKIRFTLYKDIMIKRSNEVSTAKLCLRVTYEK